MVPSSNIAGSGGGGGQFATPAPASGGGFRANLRGASLMELVQMECLAMGRSAVKISGPGGVGYLYFSGGQIVHAICGDLRGEEAALEILGWSSGSFEKLTVFDWPQSETIFCVWQSLVMRAAQKRDEEGADNLVAFPGAHGPGPARGKDADERMNSLLGRVQQVGQIHSAAEISPDGAVRIAGVADDALAGLAAYAFSVGDQIGSLAGLGPLSSAEFDTAPGQVAALRADDARVFAFRASGVVDAARLREHVMAEIAAGV